MNPDRQRGRRRAAFLLCALVLLTISCSGTAPDAPPAAPAEPYPLGPEIAQLERDLATESYRRGVLSMRNFNDVNGEIVRIDIPDNARRFAAAHGGVDRVAAPDADAALRAAYERRRRIEDDFLALIKDAYRNVRREELFEQQLARLFTEGDALKRRVEPLAPARIAPILPSPEAASWWPRWRGPSGQGHSSEVDLPVRWSAVENIAWKTPIPGRGNSSPIIWGDRIFVTTAFDDGKRRSLVAVRRADGEILWTREAPNVPPEGRVIGKNGYASATPVTDGERVVAFFGNTGLVAFDFSGEILWHAPHEPFDAMHGTGASPVLCGDLAIIFQEQSDGDLVGIAVDKRDGKRRWQSRRAAALGWSTPVPLEVDGRAELVWGAHRAVVGIDPATGVELWSCSGPTIEAVPTIVYGGGLVYSCSGRNGPTIALRPGGSGDVTASHVAWKVVRGAPHVPSPVLADGLLYQVNDRGLLTCLDAATGESVYQKRLEGAFSASPLFADGKVWLTSESGDTHVVRAGREFEVVAVSSLDEGVLASMAILDGRLYQRTTGHLWAIGP